MGLKTRFYASKLLILIVLSFLSPNSTTQVSSYAPIESDTNFHAINATSSVEYFNETSYPRYNLVGRPIDLILYPNKGTPTIIETNESFVIIADLEQETLDVEFTLISDNSSIDLIIDNELSIFVEDKWHFLVEPETFIPGLYDLQLNSSEGHDYQTHSIKILEEKKYPFNFLHISDSHFPSYYIYNTSAINLNLIQELKELDVEFAIFTGDLIEGASARMFVDPDTGLSLAAEVQLKLGLWAFDLLDMPVYIIGGNHDLDSSSPLPDDPPVIWKQYLGSYPIMTFDYLNWSFLGYGSPRTGLSSAHFNDVADLLDDISRNPNVMFYHSDYNKQATNLRNSYNIEIMLYGHEHKYEQYVSKNTLYYCQSPMFYNDSTVFTILNSTAVSVNGTEYDFTPLLIYTETPTQTDESTLILLSLMPILILITLSVIRRKKKLS